MLAPFLFVGLGGSGGKTLRTIRHELERSLHDSGWGGEFPKAWQFLHIDVPVVADGNDPDLPPQLPPTQYVSLVPANVPYRDMDQALWASNKGALATRNALAGWRPRTNEVNIPVSRGAGQFRTIGRVITLASLETVKDRLAAAFSTLSSADITGELQRLSELYGVPADAGAGAPDPVVVLVTSIAGGSGAGMFLDISDVIRAVGGGPGDHSIGILYAPDVFDELPEAARRGVRPNAMAALAELMAGYWSRFGPTEEHDAIFRSRGIVLGAAAVSGPRYPILVGRRNSRVSFGTQNDAYRAMGRALAAWVRDIPVQDRIGAYTMTNWEPTAQAVADALPLKLNTQGTPFSALGFGRVSIGRPQFRAYSAQRLARSSVDRVLREHVAHRREDDNRPDHALVIESANLNFRRFVEESGLNELGPDQNAILDDLRAPTFRARLNQLRDDVLSALVESANKAEPGPKWANEIQAQTKRFSNQVRDELRASSLVEARLWVQQSEVHLVDTVASYIARLGGKVTSRLLTDLEAELDEVVLEMERESAQYRSWARDFEKLAELTQRDGKIEANHPDVQEAVKRAATSVGYLVESELRDLAYALVKEFGELVVAPLQASVMLAVERLELDETAPQGGRPSPVQTWPQGDEVPGHFKPAVNERYLEPVANYPRELSDAVARTLDKNPAPAMRAAIKEVVDGSTEQHPEQTLIEIRHQWAHSDHILYDDPNVVQTRGDYVVHLAPDEILQRADEWVSRPDSAIGSMVLQRLAEYLRGDSAVAATRRTQFKNHLLAAIDLAEPLVSINSGLLGIVHPGHNQPSMVRIASQIPFSPGHEARPDVEEILRLKGWEEQAIPGLFSDSDRESIDIFTMLGEPYEPVVFDSLMKPIAEEWGVRKGDVDGRATFWRWRRARPLQQSIPVAESVRRAMVRGWFTARALGQITTSGDRPTTIFVPSGHAAPGRPLPFPSPLLSDVTSESDRLPNTLMSLTLALAELNSSGQLAAIEPYGRLRTLGESGRGGLEAYDTASTEIEEWVLSATVGPGAPTPPPAFAGTAAGDFRSRRDALVERFDLWASNYEQLFAEVEMRTDVFDVSTAWEIREDILNALQVLAEQTRRVEPMDERF